jgi:triosephosphate isomerase
MRKVLIAANWKLNPTTSADAASLAHNIKTGTKSQFNKDVEVVFCVPFIYLDLIKHELQGSPIKLGAQNCYFEEKGAFTGEISAAMLKDFGVHFVVLGHSERRTLFGETDHQINLKVKSAVKNGLIPILCVGESLEERDKGITDEVVKSQLINALKEAEIPADGLVIAYEPIWAIGSGKTCSSEEANRVCGLIRAEVASLFSPEMAENVRVLYGGSVKASTIEEQMRQPEIDGALVGGASLLVDDFTRIISGAKAKFA